MQEASRTFNFQFGREGGGSSIGGDPPAEIQRMIQRIFDRDRPENQNPFWIQSEEIILAQIFNLI
jgi:hypothetical protein